MAIPQPNPRTVQAPPELPYMPDVSDTLTRYLRSFALWCRHGFADKLSGTVAQPGIMIKATDSATGAPTPYTYLVSVQVNITGGGAPTSPSITLTPIPLGSGQP